MNEGRSKIGKVIAYTAEYYCRDLKREVISMMVDDLIDLNLNEILKAYGEYRRDPKNRTMPLPAQIRAMLEPSLDPEQLARETTSRIIEGVSKFGYTWPQEAKEFIGEIGWSVVNAYGGWQNFCAGLGILFSIDSFNAQARELIKSRIIHGPNIGTFAQQLSYQQNSEQKELLHDSVINKV